MYRVQVIADNSGKWVGNAVLFDTVEQAVDYAIDLAARWTSVREYRVVDVDGNVIPETAARRV